MSNDESESYIHKNIVRIEGNLLFDNIRSQAIDLFSKLETSNIIDSYKTVCLCQKTFNIDGLDFFVELILNRDQYFHSLDIMLKVKNEKYSINDDNIIMGYCDGSFNKGILSKPNVGWCMLNCEIKRIFTCEIDTGAYGGRIEQFKKILLLLDEVCVFVRIGYLIYPKNRYEFQKGNNDMVKFSSGIHEEYQTKEYLSMDWVPKKQIKDLLLKRPYITKKNIK